MAKKFKRAAKKAAVKKATKKANNAAKAAVKQVKKNEKAQNLKLFSMGLNHIPIFGNIKTLYEMTTGKDMITGQKVVIPKGGSKYINLESSCPVPQNKGKTKKEKEREIIDKFIEEQRNHEKKLLKSTFNFFFEDIETMLSPDSTWKERAEAAFYTFYKPAKVADKAKDGAKIIESQAEHAKKEKEITGNKGTGKDFKNYSAKEIERKFDLKKGEFHQVKQDIVKDLTNKNSPYKDSMKKVGNNPDIHLSSDGTIRVMSKDGKTSFDTNWNIKDFLP